jgi:hypothetical protein
VWWDRAILAGRAFEDEIERELAGAAVVVVLWSRASVASSWVRNEAAEGLRRRILVPVRLDDAAVPLGFRGVQTADLSGWDGEPDAPALAPLVRAVSALLAAPAAPGGPLAVPRAVEPGTSASVMHPSPSSERSNSLEGVLLRMSLAFVAGLTWPWAPPPAGLAIAAAMVGVAALAVWARRRRPLALALAGSELELLVLGLLFAAGVTLERGALPWVEWPDLVRHFWRALVRGWVSLALLAAAAQWVTFRYFGPRADRTPDSGGDRS